VVVVVLLAAVAPFVVFAVPQVVGAEHSYVVLSGSMEPHMAPGDVVIVDEVAANSIAVGDIVTYSRDGGRSTITHRVVGFVETDADGRAFRTKGDANPNRDLYLVRRSQVVGQVAHVVPYIGHVIWFAGTRVGQGLLVLVPLVLLVLNEVWRQVGRPTPTGGRPAALSGTATQTGADEDVMTVTTTEEQDADDPAPSGGGLAVARTDLSLSVGLLVVLVAYSGWNAYRSVTVAAPDLTSVMIFAGSATGLVLVGGAQLLAARRGPNAGSTVDGNSVSPDGEVDEGDTPTVDGGKTASAGRLPDDPADTDGESTDPASSGARPSAERWHSRSIDLIDEDDGGGTVQRSDSNSPGSVRASERVSGGDGGDKS
jgi:signal peptidase